MNKKGLEMKILMTWLFVLIVFVIVLLIVRRIGTESFNILDILGGFF